MRSSGRYIAISDSSGTFSAYLPKALSENSLIEYQFLEPILSETAFELGRLDGMVRFVPEAKLLRYGYIRKEAVLSSQMAGIECSLVDLLLYENEAAPSSLKNGIAETSNYVHALEHGLRRLRLDGLPMSSRIIKETHGILMDGSGANASEFRRAQNWIGGTSPGDAHFVPPPAHEVIPAMGDLEKFLRSANKTIHPLIIAGFVHAQFDTIHPFIDGNGRTGRLLPTFVLCSYGLLQQPLLYPSAFFKENEADYKKESDSLHSEGEWEQWLSFYLKGLRDVTKKAYLKAEKIIDLFNRDNMRVEAIERSSRVAHEEFNILKERIMLSIPIAARLLNTSFPTAASGLAALEKAGIVQEITGGKRDRVYAYADYLDLLSKH